MTEQMARSLVALLAGQPERAMPGSRRWGVLATCANGRFVAIKDGARRIGGENRCPGRIRGRIGVRGESGGESVSGGRIGVSSISEGGKGQNRCQFYFRRRKTELTPGFRLRAPQHPRRLPEMLVTLALLTGTGMKRGTE